ncbi:N-acetylmuramoyl-L-alanine amidase [Desulfosporosinus acidiphilus SJ4]|uniref:N-acetylmuramoyl-L-alanine amidase n=1 Tax=Desulfosporosinus acidiphilus (strain DSM 22704 / JCM 16185 / SJ4) TaxID=646529 RepID=I4D5Z2_DESAJ|nr:N-acetylmuramoyl-L-alanine amidase [Desulfosporosinus acidiphilus]AFM41216.1 N-acetylmuramoyl-L-alanine amidase [Desulfosporosinus acidiphilus SJ4]
MFHRPIILLIRKPILMSLIILLTVVIIATGTLKTTFSQSLKNKIIVIDPGHGGADPGAKNSGIKEKDVNLDISLRLRNSLEAKGCTVILTREIDKDFYDPGQYVGRSAKRTDLNRRVSLASSNNADVFISIHANSFPSRKTYGMETYYHQESLTGKILAEQIQEHLIKLQPDNTRKAKSGDYYLLNQTKMPAVIVEVGFMSNPRERKLLLTDGYRNSIAAAIADGIAGYFETPKDIREGIKNVSSQEGPTPIGKDSYNLYFSNISLDGLGAEKRVFNPTTWNKLNLTQKSDVILKNLIEGPTSPIYVGTLSPKTKIISLVLHNDIITVNFSKDIREDYFGSALEEDIAVKSIVWSLTQLPGVNGVNILIDGEFGDSIGGHVVFDHVLNPRS